MVVVHLKFRFVFGWIFWSEGSTPSETKTTKGLGEGGTKPRRSESQPFSQRRGTTLAYMIHSNPIIIGGKEVILVRMAPGISFLHLVYSGHA